MGKLFKMADEIKDRLRSKIDEKNDKSDEHDKHEDQHDENGRSYVSPEDRGGERNLLDYIDKFTKEHPNDVHRWSIPGYRDFEDYLSESGKIEALGRAFTGASGFSQDHFAGFNTLLANGDNFTNMTREAMGEVRQAFFNGCMIREADPDAWAQKFVEEVDKVPGLKDFIVDRMDRISENGRFLTLEEADERGRQGLLRTPEKIEVGTRESMGNLLKSAADVAASAGISAVEHSGMSDSEILNTGKDDVSAGKMLEEELDNIENYSYN